jgi:hypothetical protein
MRLHRYFILLLVLIAVPAFCQTVSKAPSAVVDVAQSDTSAQEEEEPPLRADPRAPISNTVSDDMLVPVPVSTGGYSMEFASETPRSNYVSGGLTFMSTYDDNIEAGFSGRRISDDSYSVMPTFSWRQSSSRVLWNLAYAPGFTLYHHHSGLNQYPQNLSLDSQFRLSPHITLSLRDGFAKTSNPFNQLTPDLRTSSGLTQPVAAIISPVTDQITNSGSAQVTYQFGLNSMIGATGLFSYLHYLNPSQVPGLSNSQSTGAEGFYSLRISGRHYVGTRYQFATLLSTPNHAQTETQSVVMFYTIYLQPNTSLSLYAGPQYSDSYGGGLLPVKNWSPSYGGSVGWQGQRTSFALSAGRTVSAGGGLQGAVNMENATAFIRRQLTKAWIGGLSAYYENSLLLTSQLSATNGGHSISGTLSLHRQIRETLALELAYTRLHQSYPNVTAVSAVPNVNRVWLSLSYQFTRLIGR